MEGKPPLELLASLRREGKVGPKLNFYNTLLQIRTNVQRKAKKNHLLVESNLYVNMMVEKCMLFLEYQ